MRITGYKLYHVRYQKYKIIRHRYEKDEKGDTFIYSRNVFIRAHIY